MKEYCIDTFGMPYFPGVAVGKLHRGIEGATASCILLITPREIAPFAKLPAGFIIVEAAPFSHTMIGLLALGVPTVLISAKQAEMLEEDVQILIDGVSGRITNDISENLKALPLGAEAPFHGKAGQAVSMADGEPVNLCASVRCPAVAKRAVEVGAKAIGLVRSEYLLPADENVPNAAFYRHSFREICEAASPLTVTFRLLDVAADKKPKWLPRAQAMGQTLGLQGVRLYGYDPVQRVVDAQLAALSELANEFTIRLLIPFIVRLEEFDYWSALIERQFPDAVPVGAMAETLASVLDIAHLLEHADFVAIGCNDLMQGLYAADRDQPDLRHYLDPYAPVLFRLFRQVAEQSGDHLRKVQLCGVLSQLQGVLPVLLGLGFRTFSLDVPFIPYLSDIVARTTRAECESVAAQVCAARETREVLEILRLPQN